MRRNALKLKTKLASRKPRIQEPIYITSLYPKIVNFQQFPSIFYYFCSNCFDIKSSVHCNFHIGIKNHLVYVSNKTDTVLPYYTHFVQYIICTAVWGQSENRGCWNSIFMSLMNIKNQIKILVDNVSYWGAYYVWAVIYYHNRYIAYLGFTRVQLAAI